MRALFFTLINNYWLHSSFDYDECECGDMCEGSLMGLLISIIKIRIFAFFSSFFAFFTFDTLDGIKFLICSTSYSHQRIEVNYKVISDTARAI